MTLDEFKVRVQPLDGKVLETDARGKAFTVHVRPFGLEFIPHETQHPRLHPWDHVASVLRHHAATDSLKPGDYHGVTFNASYSLRVLRAVLESR